MVYRNNPCGQYATPLNVIDRVAARHSVSLIFQLCFEEMQILHNSGYVAEVGIPGTPLHPLPFPFRSVAPLI